MSIGLVTPNSSRARSDSAPNPCFSAFFAIFSASRFTSPFASKISRVGFQICLAGSWITPNGSPDLL
jgi:hypothetical protein